MKKKNYKWVEEEITYIKHMGGDTSKSLKKRQAKFLKQYEEKGWTDIDTWNLDVCFVTWIIPRLERFIELNTGIPHGHTENSWLNVLNDMLDGFKIYNNKAFDTKSKDDIKKIEKAFTLFSKNVHNLWS